MANKPTFGDDFYKWVSTESSKTSLDYTKANFAKLIQNYFTVYFDFQFKNIQSINVELSELSILYKELENELSNLTIGNENIEVEKWIKRSETSSNLLYRLVELRKDFDKINAKQKDKELLWSKKNFYQEGLFHISYELFLESFIKLGSEYSTKLNETYGVTITFATDTADDESSISTEVHYQEGSMLLTVAKAIVDTTKVSGPWAVFIFVIIIGYEVWKMGEERKKFEKEVKKQQKKYAEAMVLLGSKIPTQNERFNIYNNLLNEISNKEYFKVANSKFESINMQLNKLWGSLFKAATSQRYLSDNYLTVTKVEEVKKRYLNDNVVRRIFEQISSFDKLQLLQENWNYLLLKKRNVNSIRTKSLSTVKELESYYCELYTSYLFLKDLESKSSSIPFKGIIPKRIEFIIYELKRLKSNNNFLESVVLLEDENKLLFNNLKEIQIKEIEFNDKKNKAIQQARTQKSHFSLNKFSGNQDQLYWINHEDGAGFGLTLSLSDFSYRSRFSNHYDSLNDNVMHSPFDGGYSTDNRRVTAEVHNNIKNIKERTQFLKSDYQGLEKAMENWILSNKTTLSNIKNKADNLDYQVSTTSLEFQTIHAQNLKPLMDSMDDILDNIDTSTTLSQRLRNSGIESGTLALLPSHMANPLNNILNSYGFTQRNYPNGEKESDFEFEFLKKKKENFKMIVKRRVKDNHSNNRLDPILGDQSEWNEFLLRSKAYWRFSDVLSNENINESNWDFFKLNEVRNFYIKKSESLMYSSVGAIEKEAPSEYEFISKESATYILDQLHDALSDYFDGDLPNPPKGLENTACNIFVANALLEFYGVPDLVNLQNNAGDFYTAKWLANDIIKELVKSDNWSELGVATSQSDIDNAAYYATIGFPVVAVRPGKDHGHITLISPGYPDFKSTTWDERADDPEYSHIDYTSYKDLRLLRVINYSLNEIRYSGFNIPFSKVFRSPEKVIFFVRKP